MPFRLRAGVESSLGLRLAWLTALRLVVLTAVLAVTTTVYLRGFSFGSFSSQFALVTVAIAYFLAAIYAVLLRVGRALDAVAIVQLVTDQITWTGIVYISGGPLSGATSLYGLTCLSGAILLGLRGGVIAAISGAVAFLALCGSMISGALLAPHDQPIEAYSLHGTDIGYALFVNLLIICVVTLLASYLAERLRIPGGDLESATARAQEVERLAGLGRLAAGLAHEIRNPLGAIAGSIELLRTGGTLSEEDRHLCEIVERETSRLNDLVGDMLDLSRPRAPVKAPVDLGAIARDVVILAARSGRGSDVSVTFDGPEIAEVLADAAQLRQVVWNLVRNAIQASSPGQLVKVVIREDAGKYALEVRDQGPGIPLEARLRLFEAFFTTRTHGMGIGLAVVKRILDDHGFPVDVSSPEGAGTTIRVTIPIPSATDLEQRSER
jgi:signal transduction histidine kinase